MSTLDFRTKILTWSSLAAWRKSFRATGRKLVVTNGCFDILHLGHASYLEQARNQGDVLLVGVNSDQGVRELKGPTRPLNDEGERAALLAALQSVDFACVFPGKRAIDFLATAQPDVYVKGGDYTLETLDQQERAEVEKVGGQIVLIPFLPGRSTTGLLSKIQKL